MYVRLAFAVAAHLEPEILIVDEVLAVGDAAFQRKCLGKMSEVAEGGRTVILVSHNMAAISQLCSRAIWLHEGRLKLVGPIDEVVTAYSESYSGVRSGGPFSQHGVMGDGRVKLLSYEVLNEDLRPAPLPVTGKDLTIRMRVEVSEPISQPQVGISLWTASGTLLTSVGTEDQGVELEPWPAGEMNIDVVVRKCDYLPGPYKADIWVMGPQGMHAHAEDAIQFEIGESRIYGTSQVDQGWGCVFSDIEFVGPASDETRSTRPCRTKYDSGKMDSRDAVEHLSAGRSIGCANTNSHPNAAAALGAPALAVAKHVGDICWFM